MIYLFYSLKLALYHIIDIRSDLSCLITTLSGGKKSMKCLRQNGEAGCCENEDSKQPRI